MLNARGGATLICIKTGATPHMAVPDRHRVRPDPVQILFLRRAHSPLASRGRPDRAEGLNSYFLANIAARGGPRPAARRGVTVAIDVALDGAPR